MARNELPSVLDDGISQDIITLEVGEAEEPVRLFRDILCAASEYFQRVLRGNFSEANKDAFPIPDFTVQTIKYFQVWLSCRKLPAMDGNDTTEAEDLVCFCCGGQECVSSVPEADKRLQFRQISADEDKELEDIIEKPPSYLTELYHFADRFDVPLLRADIISEEWSFSKDDGVHGYRHLIYSSRHLSVSSPYLRLLIDGMVHGWNIVSDYSCPTELLLRQKIPSEVLFILLAKVKERELDGDKRELPILCMYHEHEQTDEAISACGKSSKRGALDLEDD